MAQAVPDPDGSEEQALDPDTEPVVLPELASEPLPASPQVWNPNRYDRWLACPASMTMEHAVRPLPEADVKAFAELAGAEGQLALQILRDGPGAALMHLAPGSVCLACKAEASCPKISFDVSDLVNPRLKR